MGGLFPATKMVRNGNEEERDFETMKRKLALGREEIQKER
jgi:hypothetical protein